MMKKLIQVIYISRSTFESLESVNQIEPNVARILAKSRVNNRKSGLVGVLYFGDGAFFQCLEGEEEAVVTLLTKLETDPRHKDIKILSRKNIDELSFGVWAMKFTPLDEKITQFLKENGLQSFDPYQFTPEITDKFMSLLFSANDYSTILKLPESVQAALGLEQQNNVIPFVSQTKTNIALAIAIVALIISLYALIT